MKRKLYSELCYVLGIFILALGTAMMTKADFGVSMVVAPAYIIYLKLSQYLSFMTFGIAEYILQGILLVLLTVVVRRFRLSYLFSFVTALIYGVILDFSMLLVGLLPCEYLAVRLTLYCIGFLITSAGVAFLFNTYLSPAVYELFVKEVSGRYGFDLGKCKTIYDCTSCAAAILMSFAFFGLWQFEGIGIGTVICALINGTLIGFFSSFLNKHFEFADKYPKLRYFFKDSKTTTER